MDPLHPTPTPPANNQPTEPTDLSYQVMPQDGGHFEPAAPAGPIPPRPTGSPVHDLPSDSEPSFFRGKLMYIIGGAVILLILGFLAYFMLGSKKATDQPATQTATTKLPKVWLQQYFNKETCDDQNTCGDDADPDNDGLKNYDEFKAGTNPTNPDTDADGLADGDEVNIYKTEPTLKYTDRRDIVSQNNWTDGYQIKNGYDPLTPSLKFTDVRKQQIADDTTKFSLHEPSITTLGSTNAASSSDQNSTAPKTVSVTIQNMQFSPSSINVSKGDTVIWTNKDTVAHTVTGDNGGPASNNIPANGTYSYVFTTTGTFAYHCTIHPTMTGTVIVK